MFINPHESVDHPWQSGPTELFSLALNHLYKNSDFNRRIAFLLFDIGVETLLKTYLTLPDEKINPRTKFYERKKATEGSFHELVRGVKSASPELEDFDLTHLQFYHDIRNKLYHQGNGITVHKDHLYGYARLAIELLFILLGVDLRGYVTNLNEKDGRYKTLANEITTTLDNFRYQIHLAIEEIEPKLLMPSITRKLQELSSDQFAKRYEASISQYYDLLSKAVSSNEIREWLFDIVEPELEFASDEEIENQEFLFDLFQDPINLYLLIIWGFVLPEGEDERKYFYKGNDLRWIENDEEHIVGLYNSVKLYVDRVRYYSNVLSFPQYPNEVIQKEKERETRLKQFAERLKVLMENRDSNYQKD